MQKVVLREITPESFHECIRLQVADDQVNNVASNVYSLAQAKVNPLLVPLGIYDGSILGREPRPDEKMVGFLMFQVMEGVGFIMRLMIGEEHQQKGYGRTAMVEVIRRLKMMPEIEFIGTSVAKGNDYVEKFYRDLGFIDADKVDEKEIYLKLDWAPGPV